MQGMRQRHDAVFKAKVAIEALKGGKDPISAGRRVWRPS